ncbi:MAG: hypothetical protein KY432_01095 [Acidobacteria bacterium]|nr:hypothetical protein [Acidobacteriota bacterium]
MNIGSCHRESELVDSLGRGFVGSELEAHVENCSSCSELRLVAGALLDEHAAAMSEAHLPSSGTMWWRMQIRQRHDAQSKARQTLLAGQAVTFIVAIALIVALLGPDIVVGVREMITTIRLSTPLLIAVATWVLLAPIAGWAALRQK